MRHEKKENKLLPAKGCLILGGVGFLFSCMYASFLYPSPIRISGRRLDFIELLFSLIELAKNEPVGGLIVSISVLLIVIGIILLKTGRRKSRD